MPIPRFLSPGGTSAVPASAKQTPDPTATLLRRSEPFRCLLISLTSVFVGVLMWYILMPLFSNEDLENLLHAHLPQANTHPILFWLRLFAARIPMWLLLIMAGFTRFSGGLTSAVLGYRGLCDGAAMGLLWSVLAGDVSVRLPSGLSPLYVCIAYVIWLLLDLSIRLLMTVGARRMAREERWSEAMAGRMDPRLREMLWQYLTLCLVTLCATLAACGIYTAILFI